MNAKNGLREHLTIEFPGSTAAKTGASLWTNYAHQGKLNIPNKCTDLIFVSEDLQDEGEIGRGAYGSVNRMIHKSTDQKMAVKRIRSTLDESQQRSTLNDLDVIVKSANCPFIVRFYGALFREGDCWICMELMSTSLDKFYRYVYGYQKEKIPERILGKVAVGTVKALDYLRAELKVIHRDVKPSNILIDREGNIKLCDFGISGQLIDSIAKSRDAGCKPYMAPERIHPKLSAKGYDIRSDVWSLGITMIEMGTGKFPYPAWESVFEQLTCVLHGDPPKVNESMGFSKHFQNFIERCLEKDYTKRPRYEELKQHPFFINSEFDQINVSEYFCKILDSVPQRLSLNDFVSQESLGN